ncbi:MAG: hypothetical protein ACRC8S_15060 [Fimbriiglobus sp.]
MATEPSRKLFAGAGLAALRQGAKELATATKAFPDSISVEEPGGPFTPTQGEIAAENRKGSIFDRIAEHRETTPASPSPGVAEPSLDRD